MNVDWSDRFWSKVHPEALSGCWLWHGAVHDSSEASRMYGLFYDAGKMRRAHRIAYRTVKGPVPRDLFVRHSCDTPLCVNPDHLLLGTHDDNMADKVARGRQSRLVGPSNPHATLTWEIVREMRARYARGERPLDIAASLGVRSPDVSRIAHGLAWREPGMLISPRRERPRRVRRRAG